ncbi:MAG: YfcE family phosphodiesterase [Firmicutes bacterium]|nr:YfcE family phosphodiesterase [Bacillota bacterium]
MKIIIAGDSHGSIAILKQIILREQPFDRFIHLGDGLEDFLRLQRSLDFSCSAVFEAVNGNSDPPGMFPEELALKLGKITCLFTHGHHYQVHQGPAALVQAAKQNRAKYVFYGHTHQASDKTLHGIRLINPGTVCFYLSPEPSYVSWETTTGEILFHKCK